MFHVLFQVMITKEVPVPILKAYIPIPRHIHKGVFIRQTIASHFCTAVMASNFEKNPENYKRELSLNVFIPFSIITCCLVVT